MTNLDRKWETGSTTQATTRYGCFLPDLTGLARGLPIAGLPLHYISPSRDRGKLSPQVRIFPRGVDFAGPRSSSRIAAVMLPTAPMRRRENVRLYAAASPAGALPTLPPDADRRNDKEHLGWSDKRRVRGVLNANEGVLKANEKLTFDAGRVMRSSSRRVMVTDGFFAESCPYLDYRGTIKVRQIDRM